MRSYILLLSFIFIQCFIVCPAYSKCLRSDASPPANFLGLQLLHAEADSGWTIAHDLGTDWVKIVIYWNLTETEPGKFDWKWSDLAFEQIRKHPDIKILLSINDTPAWLKDHKQVPKRFRKYLSLFLSRYHQDLPHLTAIEIFNEPNNPGYGWLSLERDKNTLEMPIEESAALFADILRISNELIRPAAPHALLVSGGLFSHENTGAYMKAMFQHNIHDCIDIFGYHPYAHPHQLIETQTFLQEYLEQLGIPNTPVWYTEYGTTDNDNRADTIKTVFRAVPKLNAQFWFLDRDFGVFSDTYGLVDYFGKSKPEYALFKQLMQKLRTLPNE